VRQVLRTSSVSFAESLRIALEAEGITAAVGNENSAGITPTAARPSAPASGGAAKTQAGSESRWLITAIRARTGRQPQREEM